MIYFFFAALGFVPPFTAIQFARDWRSLFFVTAATLAVMALILGGLTGGGRSDPLGALIGWYVLSFAGAGTVVGLATRSATLVMAARGQSLKRRLLVILGGLLLIPTTLLGLGAMNAARSVWHDATLSSPCSYNDTAQFSIDDVPLAVPGLPGLMVRLEDRQMIYFSHIRSLDKFCTISQGGQAVLPVNSIHLDLMQPKSFLLDRRFSDICYRAQWPREVCDGDTPLHGLSIYNDGVSPGDVRSTYGDLERIKSRYKEAVVASDVPGFAFNGDIYYWIDPEADGLTTSPLAIGCIKSGDGLSCDANDLLIGNVRLKYSGTISKTNAVEDARAMRRQVYAIVAKMRQPITTAE